MARPTAYSRVRQMVMQATMIGLLLAALGAAALLGRSRERQWAVELNPTPHLADRLAMRLPRNWQIDQTPEGELPLVVTATQLRPGGEVARVVQVVQVPTDADTGDALLGAYLAKRQGLTTAVRPFQFLGRPGVVVEFTSIIADEPDELAAVVVRPECYAATVVRGQSDSGKDIGVVVALLQGPGGASGTRLVQQVAGGLVLRGAGGTGRPSTSP